MNASKARHVSVLARLLVALATLAATSTSVLVMAPQAVAAVTCGDTLATVNGVDVYSNAQNGSSWGFNNCGGGDNYIGGVDAGGKWQCVEFVNRYYLTKGWTSGHWFGNGNSLKDSLPSAKFSSQLNGNITKIVPGDVVTLDDGGYGHAGVVSSVDTATNQVMIANQNIGTTVIKTVTYNPTTKTLSSEVSGYSTQAVIHTSDNTASGIGAAGSGGFSGYQLAFQDNSGHLWSGGNAGWSNLGLGLAAGTSPGIAVLPSGGWNSVFQADTGDLWLVGSSGWSDLQLGMATGTSPSIATLSGGGYEVAFQANNHHLWVVGNAGWADTGLGMAAGTSPAITALHGGGYEVAFQDDHGSLWVYGNAGTSNLQLGMAAGTSPAITGLSGGGYQLAFQDNSGGLWTGGSAGWSNTQLGMASSTSPSITALSNGSYQLTFQDNGGHLWVGGSAGWSNLGYGMAAGTSPAIAGLLGGGYEVAFQDDNGSLWVYGNAGSGNLQLGMATGTTPCISAAYGGSCAP